MRVDVTCNAICIHDTWYADALPLGSSSLTPKTPIMTKPHTNSHWGAFYKRLTNFLQTVKVMKNKESLRNWPRWQKTKERWELNATEVSRLDLELEKRTLVETLVTSTESVFIWQCCPSINFLVLANVSWLLKMLTSGEAGERVCESSLTYLCNVSMNLKLFQNKKD